MIKGSLFDESEGLLTCENYFDLLHLVVYNFSPFLPNARGCGRVNFSPLCPLGLGRRRLKFQTMHLESSVSFFVWTVYLLNVVCCSSVYM